MATQPLVLDSFSFPVADVTIHGSLVTGISSKCSYLQQQSTSEDEITAIISFGNSKYYPVNVLALKESDIADFSSKELFQPTINNEIKSATYYRDRVTCDLCSLSTTHIHKLEIKSDVNLKSLVKKRGSYFDVSKYSEIQDGIVEVTEDGETIKHCHQCMQDIHRELVNYLNTDGKAVVLGSFI